MKITKRQLRRIIKEEVQRLKESDPYGDPPRPGEQGSADETPADLSYGAAMAQVDQILNAITQLPASSDQIDGLLNIVGNDGDFETDEARSAILSLEDRDGGTSRSDVENYIIDALRAQGR